MEDLVHEYMCTGTFFNLKFIILYSEKKEYNQNYIFYRL